MSTLYEIDMEIMSCIDPETGEIIDYERLDALSLERDRKIEGVALWIKNLQSDVLAFKAEKEAFDKREKAAAAKADQLKKWLAAVLGGERFSTAKCAVSFRRSEQVEIYDENAIPKELMVETVVARPDKLSIKKRLKDGEDIIGCRLIESLNTQIK